MSKIRVVARVQMKVGGKLVMPPPSSDEARASQYVFALPPAAAAQLCRQGRVQPAFAPDVDRMRTAGVSGQKPFYGPAKVRDRVQPPKPAEPAVVASGGTEGPSGLIAQVEDALEKGRKDPLVAALDAIGLDPADFSKNSERAEALSIWLENHKDVERQG